MTIKVWSLETLKIDVTFHAHDDPVCTLTGSDTHLFSGSLKSIKVHTTNTHTHTHTLHNSLLLVFMYVL